MAFGKIKETTDEVVFERYYGVAPVKVLAINPDKAKLEALGMPVKEEPKYLTVDEQGAKHCRVTFIIQTIAEKCNGIEAMTRLNFNLTNKYVKGANSGKYMIMDIYGRTAWATKEEIQAQQVPMYANGPANIDKNYKPLYEGQEQLTNFIRTFLGIPSVTKFENNVPVGLIDNPEDAVGVLDKVADYFKGDLSELTTVFAELAPNNWIKTLWGVKTDENGRQWQDVYNRWFVSGASSKYNKLSKELQNDLAVGRYASVFFGPTMNGIVVLNPLTKFEVVASKIDPANVAMPEARAPQMPDTTDDMPF